MYFPKNFLFAMSSGCSHKHCCADGPCLKNWHHDSRACSCITAAAKKLLARDETCKQCATCAAAIGQRKCAKFVVGWPCSESPPNVHLITQHFCFGTTCVGKYRDELQQSFFAPYLIVPSRSSLNDVLLPNGTVHPAFAEHIRATRQKLQFDGGRCNQCGLCQLVGGPKFKICSACKNARYCTAECQRHHWRQHKKTCSTDRKARESERVASADPGGKAVVQSALISDSKKAPASVSPGGDAARVAQLHPERMEATKEDPLALLDVEGKPPCACLSAEWKHLVSARALGTCCAPACSKRVTVSIDMTVHSTNCGLPGQEKVRHTYLCAPTCSAKCSKRLNRGAQLFTRTLLDDAVARDVH